MAEQEGNEEEDEVVALIAAVLEGDAATTRALLSAGVSPQQLVEAFGPQGPTKATLLCLACTRSIETASLLLEHRADPNTPNSTGMTALMTSAKANAADAVRLLVKHGAALDTIHPQHGGTALHFAAVQGSMKAVRALLELGCDPTIVDSGLMGETSGCTATQRAAQHGQTTTVDYLDRFALRAARPRIGTRTSTDGRAGQSEEDIIWSGLETDGMRALKCSLRFAVVRCASAGTTELPAATMRVNMDESLGDADETVQFLGCRVLQLQNEDREAFKQASTVTQMPSLLTVAGPVTLTQDDLGHFEVMYRSQEQAAAMGLNYEPKFEWPDSRAVLRCPACDSTAMVGCDYIMVFQTLMQSCDQGFSLRMMQRLVCESCFEEMVDGLTLEGRRSPSSAGGEILVTEVPVSNVVTQMGEITWLGGAAREASDQKWNKRWGEKGRERVSAWQLNSRWVDTGAWSSLQESAGRFVSSMMSSTGKFHVRKSKSKTAENHGQHTAVMTPIELHELYGRVCDGPECEKKHGFSKIKLSQCSGCKQTRYCSKGCMKSHWPAHREECKRIQAEKAARKAKKAEVEAARIQAEEAAAYAETLSANVRAGAAGVHAQRKTSASRKGGKKSGKNKKK